MSIVQGAIEAALALPLAHKLAAIFVGLPVLAIVLNVLSQLVSRRHGRQSCASVTSDTGARRATPPSMCARHQR